MAESTHGVFPDKLVGDLKITGNLDMNDGDIKKVNQILAKSFNAR